MFNQRSTILIVTVIVAAIVLIALAFSQQQQAAKDTEIAETAQAAAESDQATAVATAPRETPGLVGKAPGPRL